MSKIKKILFNVFFDFVLFANMFINYENSMGGGCFFDNFFKNPIFFGGGVCFCPKKYLISCFVRVKRLNRAGGGLGRG